MLVLQNSIVIDVLPVSVKKKVILVNLSFIWIYNRTLNNNYKGMNEWKNSRAYKQPIPKFCKGKKK